MATVADILPDHLPNSIVIGVKLLPLLCVFTLDVQSNLVKRRARNERVDDVVVA